MYINCSIAGGVLKCALPMLFNTHKPTYGGRLGTHIMIIDLYKIMIAFLIIKTKPHKNVLVLTYRAVDTPIFTVRVRHCVVVIQAM